jgi:hypothetical protein
VKRRLTPPIDRSNDETAVPSFLTCKATEESLACAVMAAQEPDPGHAILTQLQVSPEMSQFVLSADRDATRAMGRDETVPQGTNDMLAEVLVHSRLCRPVRPRRKASACATGFCYLILSPLVGYSSSGPQLI